MIVLKNHNLRGHLIIKNQFIKRVQKLTYPGAITNKDWDPPLEIKCKKAREKFRKMLKVFKCHDLSLVTKIRLLWYSLYYYMESKLGQ